jgi:hypothetical protein
MVITIPVEPHVADYLKGAVGEVIDFSKIKEPNVQILYILMDRPKNYREKQSKQIIDKYPSKIRVRICDEWQDKKKLGLTPGDTVIFNTSVSMDIYDKLKEQLNGAGKGYNFKVEWRRFIDRYEINEDNFPWERAKKYFQRHKPLKMS